MTSLFLDITMGLTECVLFYLFFDSCTINFYSAINSIKNIKDQLVTNAEACGAVLDRCKYHITRSLLPHNKTRQHQSRFEQNVSRNKCIFIVWFFDCRRHRRHHQHVDFFLFSLLALCSFLWKNANHFEFICISLRSDIGASAFIESPPSSKWHS